MEISIIIFWRLAIIVGHPFTNNYMDLKNYYGWDNTYLINIDILAKQQCGCRGSCAQWYKMYFIKEEILKDK